ncbi:MFS transporter [Pseudomonas sp. 148P]|uniref:MFS transporter n=1 Tax=Pseudomonas ulcerans TaxID=3115852 RepID=A0ABU7HYK8_9PSED|nr:MULTISPECIES: MFS transporter [unclassified Pseudomonas]MEE1925167.1 MFS transporter [Pseudomonas sp. 147P]MEE1936554.1 MFS transporter [Pseudomonas sp. 148P]
MTTKLSDNALLGTILLAIFVVPSSISGTALALPAIGSDIQASLTHLQWVVNAFNLAFACFTLAWGALADRLGRKRCFVVGAVLYVLASVISALATDAWVLDLGRALAGIGAAAIFSCGIAILSTHFDGAARLRAFALFGTVAGLGVSLGPTLSGLLIESVGWRAIFWAHTLTLVLVLLGTPLISRDGQLAEHQARFDLGGTALFVLALLALMVAIVQGSQWGWSSPGVLGLVALAVLLLAAFTWQERRHRQPMLDLSLLTSGPFVGLALVTVAASFGFVTLLTYLPSYLFGVLRLSPTQAGLAMLLLTVPMLFCPILAGKWAARGVSAVGILKASLLALLTGVASLALVAQVHATLWQLAAPLLLVGAGMGLSAGLVDGLALRTVPEQKAGMAAGLLNTFRLGSEAIAVAVYGSLLATLLDGRLRSGLAAFSTDAATVRHWLDSVAAGNLDSILQGVAEAQSLGELFRGGYDGAFHGVLWFLAAVILLLTLVISWLVRPLREQERGALAVQ